MNAMPTNLSQFWFLDQAAVGVDSVAPGRDFDAATPTQQQELDALVERVNAARSVF
jgi:hypothetical protein